MLAFVHDLVAVFVAWGLAFLLRFNFEMPTEYVDVLFSTVVTVVIVDGAVFFAFRLYRGLWRYASIHDIKLLLIATGVCGLAVPAAFLLLRPEIFPPRSVFVLHPVLLAAIMSGSRLAYRTLKDRRLARLGSLSSRPVLVLGAGDAAAKLLKELTVSPEWRVVGALDDDPRKHGHQLVGTTVLGHTDRLPEVAAKYGAEHAIIAMPGVSHHVRKRLVDLCQSANLKPLTVPSLDDLLGGRVAVSQIRQVELDDLLGRDPVKLDSEGLNRLVGSASVMVTGAGGSIGSELCRQIAKFSPAQLILFEMSEYLLYRIEQEFREAFPQTNIVCIVGDVKNASRVDHVFSVYRPKVVFHAAAYKHVPLMEDDNAWEGVRNNVGGALVLGRAAIRHEVERFVLVSTDKAVNPANVMGASKRLAEMICQRLQASADTRFVLVRFGNVLGSTGSVIPKFRKQIAQGGPVTVTHPDVTRYFMSIPEAAQLVLQAGLMGEGGEIFVLDMGESVRITDLAREMIRLSGFSEDEIQIVYTGLRPGEKLYEELLADGEATLQTPHPKLRIARSRDVPLDLLETVDAWLEENDTVSDAAVREELKKWIPEYRQAAAA